ncbi:MAG: hypothetical protein FWG66_07060, partial [Spirochaetes bacterium]|nr:hypothetical protein [Spirochaetota bacterium]
GINRQNLCKCVTFAKLFYQTALFSTPCLAGKPTPGRLWPQTAAGICAAIGRSRPMPKADGQSRWERRMVTG